MQRVINRWFSGMGIEPKISVEMENIEAIKSLVSAGLACSILPACSLAEGKRNSEIRVARVKDKPLFRNLGLACLDAEILPTSILELSRLIQQEIQSQLLRECAQA
jgi:DNA-binding transcriptional LysR family regulator